jgi:hypothetical protein
MTRPDTYELNVTITSNGVAIPRVSCRAVLPVHLADRILLKFFPTPRQAERLLAAGLGPYSVHGQVSRSTGWTSRIVANDVWTTSILHPSGYTGRTGNSFEGEPGELLVVDERTPRIRGRVRMTREYGISRVPELTPVVSTWRRRRVVRPVTVRVAKGRLLRFADEEYFAPHGDADCRYHRLVARESSVIPRSEFASPDTLGLGEIDDLLAVVSFAARQRIVCLQVDAGTEHGERLRFYRRSISAPPPDSRRPDDGIISLSEIDAYIPVAYKAFVSTGRDELIRHALLVSVPREGRTVESSFATLFSALETVVLWFRRQYDLEFAVSESDWAPLQTQLQGWLRKYPLFARDERMRTRARYVQGNVRALQRVPLSIAFSRFTKHFNVPLSDLWPVTGGGGVTLTEVRNRVVHGSVLRRRQLSALSVADDHLRWTLERMLLSILGWPVERSQVSADWLARNRSAHAELDQARRDMRSAPSLPVDLEAT